MAKKTVKSGYTGWLLPEDTREKLLVTIPPAYPNVKAHHVTLEYGVPPDTDPPLEQRGFVVGFADDGKGIQALVVEIGGTTTRPDGETYHITWSIDESKGYEAKMSVDLLKQGWTHVVPFAIPLEPKFFPMWS